MNKKVPVSRVRVWPAPRAETSAQPVEQRFAAGAAYVYGRFWPIVDAHFSMPFSGALATLKGNAFLDEDCLENIQSPQVKQLIQRFECVHGPETEPEFPRKWPAKVEILTRAGTRFATRLDLPKGDPENPLSWDTLTDKLHRLTTGVFPKNQRQRFIAHVRNLEDAPTVSDVLRPAAKSPKAGRLGSSDSGEVSQ